MQRREFIKLSVITASMLVSSNIEVFANTNTNKSSIVILGGGFAGLSCAKFLKELNPNLDVTLIEKKPSFTSCPFSNAWLGEIEGVTFESLSFDYNSAIEKYKYNFINEAIIDVNKEEKTVITENQTIKYDYLIMTLGIDYNYKKLFRRDKQKAKECEIKAPAGLKNTSELLKLKKMIENFKGGNFVITLPKSSYKCPPAPYERTCMIANYFKENKIDGKVILVDPRAKPASKAKVYLESFNTIYKDYVEYIPKALFKDIDFKKKKIKVRTFNELEDKYEMKEIEFSEASIIPPNRANKLYKKAKIDMYTQGWVKLKQPTFRTVSDENIYVLGDAQGEYPYPKSAQMANSCAYVVAKELISRIEERVFDYKANLPGNICYSIVAPNKAAWVRHDYTLTNKVNVSADTSNISKEAFVEAKGWYKGFTEDLFGLN